MGPPVSIAPGVVFWPLPTDKVPEPHPWIVLCTPVNGKVITVNVTDLRHYEDTTCILEIGEHECIKKRSAMYYRAFRERDAKQMGIALGKEEGIRVCAPVGGETLKRMILGFRLSKDVREAIKIQYGFLPLPQKHGQNPF